jgi:hypothetical protein
VLWLGRTLGDQSERTVNLICVQKIVRIVRVTRVEDQIVDLAIRRHGEYYQGLGEGFVL